MPPHTINGAPARPSVASRRSNPRRIIIFQIQSLEQLLRTIEQDSQILAVYSKVAANFIFVSLFEKNFAQQSPVPLGKLIENLPNLLLDFLGREHGQRIEDWGGEFLRLVV